MAGGLPKTRRRSRSPVKATELPDNLKSFDEWIYPNGLHDYMQALSQVVGGNQRLTPIMNQAGLSAADWFRKALSVLK